MKDLDIKDIWKGGNAEDKVAHAKPEIDKMIRKGSTSLIHRFIKTVKRELWFNLIILSVVGVRLFFAQEWAVGSGVIFLDVVFFLYYRKLIDNLNKEQIDSTVLEYLYNVQSRIRQFIRHLKIASFGVSVLTVAGVIILNTNGFYDEIQNPKALAITIVAGLGIALPLSFYFIHLLYGKKAKKLAHMINSLEKEEA